MGIKIWHLAMVAMDGWLIRGKCSRQYVHVARVLIMDSSQRPVATAMHYSQHMVQLVAVLIFRHRRHGALHPGPPRAQ
jgi:hypothetical protein